MTIRRMTAWIIALSMVFALVHFACADESELTWGTSKSDVIEKMGDPGETTQYQQKEFEAIGYQNKSISKYNDAILMLIFRYSRLAAKIYALEDNKELEKYYYLRDALSSKYGRPSDSAQTLYDGFIVMGAQTEGYNQENIKDEAYKSGILYNTWETDKETNILLTTIPAGDQYLLMLIYYHPEALIDGYNMNGL